MPISKGCCRWYFCLIEQNNFALLGNLLQKNLALAKMENESREILWKLII